MSADVTITLELKAGEAAALHRLCDKIGHSDALQYLYPHLPKHVRDDQAYEMVHACAALQTALEERHVGHFPWYRDREGAVSLRTADETLTWHSPHEPPDAEETVLVFMPGADEPIDFGYWDGEIWCCANLEPGGEGAILAWAHMPEGRIP